MKHSTFFSAYQRRLTGIRELLPIALPIFFSQTIDVCMVFCDRFFLSKLGKEDLAATLSGGILLYLASTLLLGTLGQVTALVGQYRGANQPESAVRTVHQGWILALLFGGFFVWVFYTFAPTIFSLFSQEELLLAKEVEYFQILCFGILSLSLRGAFSGFFIGIEKTNIVTLASFVAVIVNIPLSYALVFGEFGFPKMGIQGAALGTVVSGVLPIIIFGIRFFSSEYRKLYQTNIRFQLDKEIMYKLLRYGFPSGIEMLVNVMGFYFFTMLMYSYSGDVAAATTIVLNWDMVCFIPLFGIGQAVSGQVGKHLGESEKAKALVSAESALTLGWLYAFCITILYLSQNYLLVNIFIPEDLTQSYGSVFYYASKMLQISCLYFFFDSTYTILGGILKGSGDTIWPMFVSNAMMWTCALTVWILKQNGIGPFVSWWVLTGMVFSLGISYFYRYQKKEWLNRLMIRN